LALEYKIDLVVWTFGPLVRWKNQSWDKSWPMVSTIMFPVPAPLNEVLEWHCNQFVCFVNRTSDLWQKGQNRLVHVDKQYSYQLKTCHWYSSSVNLLKNAPFVIVLESLCYGK
jgi:hypothetical protein